MDIVKKTLNQKGILGIVLNRPDKLNALSEALLDELEQTFETAYKDPQVKSLLITGAGKAFCAGADISQIKNINSSGSYQFALKGQGIFRKLETLGKPALAAVNGYAFGGGCELSLAATIRIASKNAKFSQPEIKLGIIPAYGGTQRLARNIGKGRALDLCLRGHTIDADTALAWGLVTELTAPDQLIPRAEAILNEINQLAPIAANSIIEAINTGFDLSLDDALQLEATHFAMTCATKDKDEGISAFLEKRKAHFIGE